MNIPTLQAVEFTLGTDPSGLRNIQSGNGFVKLLGTSTNQELAFTPMNITTSGGITEPHVLLYRVSSYGDASGVSNMRFYLNSISDWSTGTYRFLQKIETHFQGGSFHLNESNNNTPTTLPANQNLFATDGRGFLSGILDPDVTQYVYLSILAEEDVPTGIYGGAGDGGFRYRVAFDFS